MKLILLLAALFLGASPQKGEGLRESIMSDSSLVAPGIGAENLLINQDAKAMLELKGKPDSIARFKSRKELFKDVYNIQSPVKIYYNCIYRFKSGNLIVFALDNAVISIIGLNNNRVTIDSINLSNGVEYFIFNYGNSELKILSRGKNRIYIYPKLGIAIADDYGDDVVDMFILFKPAE